MKCALCNNELTHQTGVVEFESRSLGNISVPNLEYMGCKGCGDRLLSPEMGDKAVDFIAEKEQEAINTLPIGEFATLNEASAILGISKQAFSKHPKIKRGFIYSVNMGDRKLYHRLSASLFKKTGDGRFQLMARTGVSLGYENWTHFPNVGRDESLQYAGTIEVATVLGPGPIYVAQGDMPVMKAGNIEVGAVLGTRPTYENQYDMPLHRSVRE